jgi:hypothetical protein
MGIDVLDVVVRLEKAFEIKLPRAGLDPLFSARHPPDMSAGELAQFVLSMLPPRRESVQGWIDVDRSCAVCEYNLRGLRYDWFCPECGSPASPEGQAWAGVRHVLSDVLGVPADGIRRDSLIIRDLGAS